MRYETLSVEGRSQNLKFDKGVIYIPKLNYPKIQVYDENNKLVMETDRESDLNYIRAQIKSNNVSGWYFEFENKRYDIKSNGAIPRWSSNIFEVENYCLYRLFGFRV